MGLLADLPEPVATVPVLDAPAIGAMLVGAAVSPGESVIARIEREADAAMREGVGVAMDRELARQQAERMAGAARATPPPPSAVPLPVPGRYEKAKIIPAVVPSSMEEAARRWAPPPLARPRAKVAPPAPGDGKAWCAQCDARVSPAFVAGCISAFCSLKVRG